MATGYWDGTKWIREGGKAAISDQCCCDPYNGCCPAGYERYALFNTIGEVCYCHHVIRTIPLTCYEDVTINCNLKEDAGTECTIAASINLDIGGGVIISLEHVQTDCCYTTPGCVANNPCEPPNMALCDE